MKLSEMRKRAQVRREKNKVILKISIADIDNEDDVTELNKYIRSFLIKIPKKAYYLLLDTRGLVVNSKIKEEFKEIILECSSPFKGSAIVVDDNTEAMMKSVAKKLCLKNMQTFKNTNTAHDYLVSNL